jgi:apolipoprotein N-acyltransferase
MKKWVIFLAVELFGGAVFYFLFFWVYSFVVAYLNDCATLTLWEFFLHYAVSAPLVFVPVLLFINKRLIKFSEKRVLVIHTLFTFVLWTVLKFVLFTCMNFPV